MRTIAITCVLLAACYGSDGYPLDAGAAPMRGDASRPSLGELLDGSTAEPEPDAGTCLVIAPIGAFITSNCPDAAPPDDRLVTCDGRDWGYTALVQGGRVNITCQAMGDVVDAFYTQDQCPCVCEVNGATFTLDGPPWRVHITGGAGGETSCQ